MQISEEHFLKFKELMKKKVGEEAYNKMTEQQLLESAIKLLTLVKIVYKPITQKEFDSVQERDIKTMGTTGPRS